MDTMGELSPYGLSTIVFVGGSLVPRGGQNILEPAAESKAVLFGPMMANRNLVDALVGRGGMGTGERIFLKYASLLDDEEERSRLGTMAAGQVAKSEVPLRKTRSIS